MVASPKFALSGVLLISLMCGCTTTNQSGGTGQASTPANPAQDVINGTKQLCQFVPTLTSILAIVNTPGAPAADKIVQAICAEVNKTTQASFIEPGKKFTVKALGKPVTGELAK